MMDLIKNQFNKHIWPVSFLGICVLVVMVFTLSRAAIINVWEFGDESNYELSDEDDLLVIGGQVLLDNVKEFQLNDLVDGVETSARIDSLSNGDFVIVWESPDTSGSDNDNSHIAAKVIDSTGSTVVSEFQVNDQETGKQYFPYVEVLSNDNIFVTWQSQAIDFGTDNSGSLISAKIIDSTGSTVIPEFQVNEEIAGLQGGPAATQMNDGNIFMAWGSADTSIDPGIGNDNSGGYVAAKIIDQLGGSVVSEFQVNEEIENVQTSPEIALMNNGNVLVTWYSADVNNAFTDTSLNYTAAKVYDSNGLVVVSEFQVNEEIENEQWNAMPLGLSNGNVVVTWSSADSNNIFTDDGDDFYIAAKVYDADMNVVVGETQINEEIEFNQRFSELVEMDNGNIFLSWYSEDTNHLGDDNQLYHIAGKILTDELETLVSEFQVNDGIASIQAQPALGKSKSGGEILNTFLSFDFTYADTDNSSSFLAAKLYQADGTEFYPDDSPWVSLVDGYVYSEAIRSMAVDVATDGSVSLQISNDDGVTWYYYDGSDWVVTVGGVEESNTVAEVNDNLAEFYNLVGAGIFNWKLFITGDGTQSEAVNSLTIEENEVPVIGNGDASVDLEVFDNEVDVARFEGVDPEDDDIEFSISGGADAGFFNISEDGLLSIDLAAERDQVYEVVVRATDSFYGYSEQTANVTVLRPIFRSGSSSSSSSTGSPFNKSEEGLDEVEFTPEETDDLMYKVSKTREKTVTEKGEYCVLDFENEVKNKTLGLSRMDAVRLFIDFMCIDVSDSEMEVGFNDIGELSDLDKKYLRVAYDLRLIEGYQDGAFRPDRILNYAELSALLYRSLESEILESNPWYVEYVKFAPVVEESKLSEAVSVSNFVGKFKNFYGF